MVGLVIGDASAVGSSWCGWRVGMGVDWAGAEDGAAEESGLPQAMSRNAARPIPKSWFLIICSLYAIVIGTRFVPGSNDADMEPHES
jgi:hypothetical protein